MIEVKLVDFLDLTDLEKESQPDNGCGKEDANYIRVVVDGETVELYSDAMSPEDCRFSRDLRWVATAIKNAYDLGRQER